MVLDIKKKAKFGMRGKIIIPQKAFRNMVRLNEEFDSIIETIEIMNDKELMKGIERSRRDLDAGRIKEMKNISDIDSMFG